MQSLKYLDELKAITCDESTEECDLKSLMARMKSLKADDLAIAIGISTEIVLLYAFDKLNVDDSIYEGFIAQYPILASDKSLYEALLDKGGADISSESLRGFVSAIKGKVYEIQLVEHLNSSPDFEGYEFSLSPSATQPIWDIQGVNADGEQILIQAKMGAEGYANEVYGKMMENPDVLFATSQEVQNKILEKAPELMDRFVGMEISNEEFTTDIANNVEQLVDNLGIDVPDSTGELIPLIAEAKLVARLVQSNFQVDKEYQDIKKSDIQKIKTLKAMVLISKFGVTKILAICGAKAGMLVDAGSGGFTMGLGTVVGGISGAFAGAKINKEINPKLYDMALDVMNYTRDDLFYLKNKLSIDDLAERFINTQKMMIEQF